jgi:hypothetical protein
MARLKRTVAGAVALGVLFIPGIAAANDRRPTATATTFDDVKTRCTKSIADRQAKLDRLSAQIAKSVDPHDADLNTIITTAKSGLIALQASIDGNAGDLATLKSDCQRIVTDLRIYALRVPQINLVMSIDTFDAAMAKLAPLHDQLAAAGDPDAAEAEAKLASATTKIDGIDIDSLLAITPGTYNADKKVLGSYLQSVRSARSDLEKASQLARHIAL